jgi:hypothetical protein
VVLQSEQGLRQVRVGPEELLLEALVLHLVAAQPAHRLEVTGDDELHEVFAQRRLVFTVHASPEAAMRFLRTCSLCAKSSVPRVRCRRTAYSRRLCCRAKGR